MSGEESDPFSNPGSGIGTTTTGSTTSKSYVVPSNLPTARFKHKRDNSIGNINVPLLVGGQPTGRTSSTGRAASAGRMSPLTRITAETAPATTGTKGPSPARRRVQKAVTERLEYYDASIPEVNTPREAGSHDDDDDDEGHSAPLCPVGSISKKVLEVVRQHSFNTGELEEGRNGVDLERTTSGGKFGQPPRPRMLQAWPLASATSNSSTQSAGMPPRAVLEMALGLLRNAKIDLAAVKQQTGDLREYTIAKMKRMGKYLLVLGEAANEQTALMEEYDARIVPLENERRRLFNELLQIYGNVRVFCRVRAPKPSEAGQGTLAVSFPEEGTGNLVRVVTGLNPSGGFGIPAKKDFEFDRVYPPEASQATIFEDVQPLVQSVMDGYNACVFAYGQTGSGKTYTMLGSGQGDGKGICYRAVDELFRVWEAMPVPEDVAFSVSMLEIYNETITDLLADGTTAAGKSVGPRKLHPLLGSSDGAHIADVTYESGSDPASFYRTIARGQQVRERLGGPAASSERGARGHLLISFRVQREDSVTGDESCSKLWLVDLAGSERLSKTQATGERLTESLHVNKSLSALGDVISALITKKVSVPYRNSKLTHVLSEALYGDAKVLLFVNVCPGGADANESVASLNFAARARSVESNQGNREAMKKWKDAAAAARKEVLEKEAMLAAKAVELAGVQAEALRLQGDLEQAHAHIHELDAEKLEEEEAARQLRSQLTATQETLSRLEEESRAMLSRSKREFAETLAAKDSALTAREGEIADLKGKIAKLLRRCRESGSLGDEDDDALWLDTGGEDGGNGTDDGGPAGLNSTPGGGGDLSPLVANADGTGSGPGSRNTTPARGKRTGKKRIPSRANVLKAESQQLQDEYQKLRDDKTALEGELRKRDELILRLNKENERLFLRLTEGVDGAATPNAVDTQKLIQDAFHATQAARKGENNGAEDVGQDSGSEGGESPVSAYNTFGENSASNGNAPAAPGSARKLSTLSPLSAKVRGGDAAGGAAAQVEGVGVAHPPSSAAATAGDEKTIQRETLRLRRELEALCKSLKEFDPKTIREPKGVEDAVSALLRRGLDVGQQARSRVGGEFSTETLATLRLPLMGFIRRMEPYKVLKGAQVADVRIMYIRDLQAQYPGKIGVGDHNAARCAPDFLEMHPAAASTPRKSTSNPLSCARPSTLAQAPPLPMAPQPASAQAGTGRTGGGAATLVAVRPVTAPSTRMGFFSRNNKKDESKGKDEVATQLAELRKVAHDAALGNRPLALLLLHKDVVSVEDQVSEWLGDHFPFLARIKDPKQGLPAFSDAIVGGWRDGIGTTYGFSGDETGLLLADYTQQAYEIRLAAIEAEAAPLLERQVSSLEDVKQLREQAEAFEARWEKLRTECVEDIMVSYKETKAGTPVGGTTITKLAAVVKSLKTLETVIKSTEEIAASLKQRGLHASKFKQMQVRCDYMESEMLSKMRPMEKETARACITTVRRLVEERRDAMLASLRDEVAAGEALVGPDGYAEWAEVKFSVGTGANAAPLVILASCNAERDLVVKTPARGRKPVVPVPGTPGDKGEKISVMPPPTQLDGLEMEQIDAKLAHLPVALCALAMARTAEGTRARYAKLYATLLERVPALRGAPRGMGPATKSMPQLVSPASSTDLALAATAVNTPGAGAPDVKKKLLADA
eukprot:jgi/Mesvir1/22837/Mv20097-RA.1